VVAKYRKYAFRRLEPAQDPGDTVDVLKSLVNEIARQHDEVGVLCLSQVHGFSDVRGCHEAATVEVGQLHHPETSERERQVCNQHLMPGKLKPRGFNPRSVMPASPTAAKPPRHVAAFATFPALPTRQ
jgi:hypothetical protein